MTCSDVGMEIWLLALISSTLFVLFTFAARPFQGWLRTHRARSGLFRFLPDAFFGDRGIWLLRLFGIIPGLMTIVAAMGVYCFFRGPG